MHSTLPLTAVALALALVALPAAAADYPTLRNGQWDLTTTRVGAGAEPRTSKICLDAATQKTMIEMGTGMQKSMCSKMDMRREGTRYISESECKFGESVVKAHGVMTMQGDTAYHTEASATYDPPIMKDVRESKTVVDGRYTGPCRDGMQPGDLMMSNGQKVNLNALQAGAAKGK